MKLTRYLTYAIITLICAPCLAEDYPNMEWFACQSDDQCVLVWGGCGDGAVNKKAVDKLHYVSGACMQSSPHYPNAVARCTNGQCHADVSDKAANSQTIIFGETPSSKLEKAECEKVMGKACIFDVCEPPLVTTIPAPPCTKGWKPNY